MAESLFPSQYARRERQYLRLVASHQVQDFDARGIAPRLRQPALAGALAALRDGESLRYVDDQQIVPLLRQVAERFGRDVGFEFREHTQERVVVEFTRHAIV